MVAMDSGMSIRLMLHKQESHVMFAICKILLLHQCDMAEWDYIFETLNRVPTMFEVFVYTGKAGHLEGIVSLSVTRKNGQKISEV